MRTFLTTAIIAVLGMIGTDIARAQNPSQRGRPLARKRFVTEGSAPTTGVNHAREIVSIQINDIDGVFPPLLQGDREFERHGPRVTVKVQYFVQGNSIYRRIYMRAAEILVVSNDLFGGVPSIAEGWSNKKRVYTAPAGKQIVAIAGGLGEVQTLVFHKDSFRHTRMRVESPLGLLKVYGDRDGIDIGQYTRAVLYSDHQMRVVLDHGAPRRVKVTLPRTMTFRPPHTRGDKDFAGHGPHIWIRAQIFKAGSHQLAFNLYMKAKETRDDFTTVEGSRNTTLYTAPIGYRIKRIVGKTGFPNLLDVVDKSQRAETYSTEIGKLHVFGDGKGDDAKVYTRVTLESDYSVEVELEPTR